MSKQYPGGIISKTAPTLNPALGNSAPGIWTMDQVAYAIQSGTWPPYDPYYKYVTLNLHGNGTNAAQNNTFLDSSTNNFSITRNGNTTQGTFTPYGSNWSNYFDGSSAYLSIANATPLQLSGSQFTIEGWFYLTVGSTDNNELVCQSTSSADSAVNYQIRVTAGNKLRFLAMTSGATAVYFDGTTTITTNTWHHFACVCDGSGAGAFLRSWVDGVYQGASSSFNAANINTNSAATQIGAWTYSSQYLSGYISNFRILKGTALYTGTSNITVPTAPLTAITNTSLLICQSNRFIDNSSNGYTVTTSGSPSVQRFSPFSPTSAYSTSVIGGSGYFDGNGDYLTAPSNAAFDFGTGDLTIECWVYVPSATTNAGICQFGDAAGTAGFQFMVNGDAGSGGVISLRTNSSQPLTTTGVIASNTWNHVAITRASNTTKIFINGTTSGGTYNWTASLSSGTTRWIGSDIYSHPLTGYIGDLRVIKGTAIYTAAFTPPTAPLTAITNTSLLLNYTNAGILDNAEMNDLETVGDAQISTSVKKYGTGSMSFDGSGDGLYRPSSDLFNFGSGSFTIEFWMYFNSKTGYQTLTSYGYTPIAATGWLVQTGNGDGKLIFYRTNAGSTTIVASDAGATVNTAQWYHIAIVKNGSTTTIYRDGTSVGSGSDTNTYSVSSGFYVGGGSDSGFNNYYFNGYLDDLRITKGYARYTTNFTPPTSQLQDQ